MSAALLWCGVAMLGAAGALARFLLDTVVASRAGGDFPFGTLAVNGSGALVLGLLAGIALEGDAYLLAGTATVGAYTTFSTWMLETHRLGEEGEPALLFANIVISAGVGLGAALLGRIIGGLL
jgi:fluoride exporter